MRMSNEVNPSGKLICICYYLYIYTTYIYIYTEREGSPHLPYINLDGNLSISIYLPIYV